MRISTELIQRCSSKHLLPAPQNGGGGDAADILERITHLYLQEQHIRKIENLQPCKNLVALYLYDNKIQTIENLDYLVHLNCLYLQKNYILHIENLDTLTQLTVLNLSHNAISKLEGLEALCELKELYLQYQALDDDQTFEFDYPTINWLSDSLRVLNLSGNKIKSFTPLKPLQYLEIFVAEENDVADLAELVDTVSNWQYVHTMKLTENPVCSVRKYRDHMVVTCLELDELDGKVIFPPYRNFLLNWKQCQTLQELKRESYAVLKPFLETQIKNKQLTPPRSARSSSVAPNSSRSGSFSSSQSESSVSSKSRSKSAQRKSGKGGSGCLQEVPRKLVSRITKGKMDR